MAGGNRRSNSIGERYDDHSLWLAWIKVWPQFDTLRGEPRFQDLLGHMGLEP